MEGAGTTSANADESVQLDRVSAAMERIPPEQRAALVQVAVEGCSYAEAAALLGVPIGTIMSRVARARKALAEDLEWSAEREAGASGIRHGPLGRGRREQGDYDE